MNWSCKYCGENGICSQEGNVRYNKICGINAGLPECKKEEPKMDLRPDCEHFAQMYFGKAWEAACYKRDVWLNGYGFTCKDCEFYSPTKIVAVNGHKVSKQELDRINKKRLKKGWSALQPDDVQMKGET